MFTSAYTTCPVCVPARAAFAVMRNTLATVGSSVEDVVKVGVYMKDMADRDAFMSVAYRASTPEGTLRHRITRRITTEYFGTTHARRDEAGR